MEKRGITGAILFFVVAWCLELPFSTAQASSGSSHLYATAVSHGLEIGLSLQQDVFPRKALIRVTLRLRNLTARPLMFGVWPEVQVLNRAGRVVYRAGYDSYPDVVHLRTFPSGPIGGGGGFPSPLRPGQSSVRQIFLVMRGARIRPVVELFTPQHPHASIGFTTAYGPTIRVRLVRGRPPHIVVSRTGLDGYEMHALVTSGNPAQRGTFWYMAVELCGRYSSNGTLDWSPVLSFGPGVPQLMTSCLGRPTEWHIAVAWLNQPLGRYDFVSR